MSTTSTTSPTTLPRPLQLVDGNIPSTPTSSASSVLSPIRAAYPLPAGLPTPPPTSRRPASANPRRQSSISYFPSDHISVRSPTSPSFSSPRPSVKRSSSLGIRSGATFTPFKEKGDRRSLGSENGSNGLVSPSERAPLTLTEKHADLLHFIAQKESKCLELKSQLAIHEEELGHLKRKWERIVSRGMDRAYTPSFPSSNMPSSSPPTSASHYPSPGLAASLLNPSNGAVLDGIKEGVQGVGRLLAAGLELSNASSSSPVTPEFASTGTGLSGVSRTAISPALKRAKHGTTQSVSSVSTSGTTSSGVLSAGTRLSHSSASSLSFAEEEEDRLLLERDGDDTIHRKTHQEQFERVLAESAISATTTTKSTKLFRRRSREAPKGLTSVSPSSDMYDPSLPAGPSSRRPTGDVVFGTLGSLSSTPVSHWMGSMGSTVGKKWEEIQKGDTFTKSQKRASVLLSDVSQSFFAALSSPTTPSHPSQSSRPIASSPLSVSTHASPFLPISSMSVTPSTILSGGSLLEDDELEEQDVMSSKGLGEVLVPVNLSSTPNSFADAKSTNVIAAQPVLTSSLDDDDDDWNW